MRARAVAAGCCLLVLGVVAGAPAAVRDDVPPPATTTTVPVPLPETTTTLPATTSTPLTTTTTSTTVPAPTSTTVPSTPKPAPKPKPKPKAPARPNPSCSHGTDLAVFAPRRAPFSEAAVTRLRSCAGARTTVALLPANRVDRLSFLSVTAKRVAARVQPVPGGWTLRPRVTGLRLAGKPIKYTPELDVPIGLWGRLLGATPVGSTAAPLAIELRAPRAGLPAGTIVLIGYVGAAGAFRPAPGIPAKVRGHHVWGAPLTVQPTLKAGPYTFPVAGRVDYGDSYGGPRSDVQSGWHHGDDIFARLGQPVLAVADGTVYSVGWEHLGGWRLWLKDHQGNRFYYAHLSGYTKLGRNHVRVHAGDVIGFIGHTGDAFTTPWHLHFEIHPAGLLRLGYDGAIDPTSYLESWRRDTTPKLLPPRPLPQGASTHGQGAVSDYRRLLALQAQPARAPAPLVGGHLPSDPAVVATERLAQRPGDHLWFVAGALAVALALLAAGHLAVRTARRRSGV
jgi:hypothetical protein